MKNKIILLVVTMLVISGYVIAWDPNPVYNPFEVIWNAINNLNDKVNTIPSSEFMQFSYLINQMEPEMEIPFEAMQHTNCENSNFTLLINGVELGEVIGFIGKEAISEPYEYYVAIKTTSSLSIDDYIGKAGKLLFERDGEQSWFNGFIAEFGVASYNNANYIYVVKLVPNLYLLSYHSGYKIFQNDEVPNIVDYVLNSRNILKYSFLLRGDYPTRKYCVQYRETDFNFISRLMEEEGIFYYFEHDSGGETMIIADQNSAFSDPSALPLNYRGHKADPLSFGEEYVRTLHKKSLLVTSKTRLKSFDFTKPSTDIQSTGSVPGGIGEFYEFVPGIEDNNDASRLAKIRLEAIQSERWPITGTSTSENLRAGYNFSLIDLSGNGFEGDYVVTSVRHGALLNGALPNEVACSYANEFEAIPSSVTFRPERTTPKPRVQGVQTAIVTGQSGEEIWSDSYGRVKVQFHWDLEGNYDETSSAWIRVANPYAGPGIGMTFIPRVGAEVVVDFIEGDPDHPIIIGTVYNANNMPPVIPEDPGSCEISRVSKKLGAGQLGGSYVDCPSGYKAIACGSYTQVPEVKTLMSGYLNSDAPDGGEVPNRCLVAWVNEGTLTTIVYGYATCCPEEKI